MNLGIALDRYGKPSKAEPEYRRAIEIEPNDADYHHNLGVCLGLQGRLAEARVEYLEALRLNPSLEKATECLQELGPE